MRGWMIDIYPDYASNSIVYWLRTKRGAHRIVDRDFLPKIFVHASEERLGELERALPILDAVGEVEGCERRIWLAEEPRRVLGVTIGDYSRVEEVARTIDSRGRYREYTLFNVDLRFSQRYFVDKGIFPMGLLELSPKPTMLDDPFEMDYELPPMTAVDLRATTSGRRGLESFEDRLLSVAVGDETMDGDEEDIIREAESVIARRDPDIVYTDGGDSFLMPYLHHRARALGIDPPRLGRDGSRRASTKGKSYFTYGRILYKPPSHKLGGRLHLDRESSFMLREGGLGGLIDLSRISRTPVQELARLSPGSAISAMEVNQALTDGCAVMWKKNLPEKFKTARELIIADRGGFIYEPRVGIFDRVLEVDFTSLYPNIMARFNISPETIMCGCCPHPSRTVPVLGYGICDRNVGLIPRVLKPVIDRRTRLKRLVKGGVGDVSVYRERSDILKWLLVTCLDEHTEVPYRLNGRFDIAPIGDIVGRCSGQRPGEHVVREDLRVFGVDEHMIPALKSVSSVMAFPAPDEMVELGVGDGAIALTPDHPCYVVGDGGLCLRRAEHLVEGDLLPTLPSLYRGEWDGERCAGSAAVRYTRRMSPRSGRVCCLSVAEPLHGFALANGVLVHNCFGYTGYRNARFGRIECHEAINAYGREIMLQTSEIAEAHGFEILHGIIDSLWLKGDGDAERFCEHASGHIGIPLDAEGVYRWIVFLPSRISGVGVLNRYYGAFEDGELKVRGIERRRSDSPEAVKDMQSEMLSVLAKASDSAEFLETIPEALEITADYVDAARAQAIPLDKLLLRRRISKAIDDYEQFNDGLAALMQLRREGAEPHPGEAVRYVVTDGDSRDDRTRVRVEQLITGDVEYDAEAYVDLLVRAAETMLFPFGHTRENLHRKLSSRAP
jgi:DNA polymerase elongation subunit (family B)